MTSDQTRANRVSAVSRSELQAESPVISSNWPRTLRREQRIESVLARRQPGLTVVLEDVHDPHNAGAVLRSCDAVGVLEVHLVYVNDPTPYQALNRKTSGSSARWIDLHFHDSIGACFASLRAEGKAIYALAIGPETISLYQADLAQPVALVFGNERRGVSAAAQELVDGTISIPMQGMVESLNISVACAVTLYEAMRQRESMGMYEAPQLDDQTRHTLTADWIKR